MTLSQRQLRKLLHKLKTLSILLAAWASIAGNTSHQLSTFFTVFSLLTFNTMSSWMPILQDLSQFAPDLKAYLDGSYNGLTKGHLTRTATTKWQATMENVILENGKKAFFWKCDKLASWYWYYRLPAVYEWLAKSTGIKADFLVIGDVLSIFLNVTFLCGLNIIVWA